MQRRPEVVLYGAGMVAGVHGAACQALRWPIRAVASRSTARAAELARTLGTAPATYEQLRSSRMGDIAIVATPPADHVDAAIALLEVGYRVVVEAPLSCTLDEADRLLVSEQRAGSSVLYAEPLVASPVVDGLLQRVGDLGHLTHLSARALQAPPSWRPDAGRDWGTDWGGGALFDIGAHPIGMVLRAAAEADAGAPSTVSAIVNDAGTDYEHATVRVRFASDTIATIVVGWQPGSTLDWDLQVSSASGVLRAELSTTPTLEHNGDQVPITSADDPGRSLVDDRGYAPQLSRFWTNIRTGRPVPTTSRLGRSVLEVILAAYRSARRGAADEPLPFTGPHDRTPHQVFTD